MFDKGLLKSTQFHFPVICVGNLSVGGTGKSPTTNYLIDLLKPKFKVAVLSRGYGRITKGFVLADKNSTAADIGDEPLMYFKRNTSATIPPSTLDRGLMKEAKIAVCENRVEGINTLKNQFPDLDIVLLDDAFQHRAVAAGLNILITDYSKLYGDDFILPAGNLRESKAGAKRAQIIIVSKCPENLSADEKQSIISKLKKSENQHFFFSFMKYAPLVNVLNVIRSESGSSSSQLAVGNKKINEAKHNIENVESLFNSPIGGWGAYDALLITGIANPKPLEAYLSKQFKTVHQIEFADHHDFTSADLTAARKKFDNIANDKKIIITTEKDWMRLQQGKLKIVLNDLPVYVQPVSFEFNEESKSHFNQLIINYVRTNKTNR